MTLRGQRLSQNLYRTGASPSACAFLMCALLALRIRASPLSILKASSSSRLSSSAKIITSSSCCSSTQCASNFYPATPTNVATNSRAGCLQFSGPNRARNMISLKIQSFQRQSRKERSMQCTTIVISCTSSGLRLSGQARSFSLRCIQWQAAWCIRRFWSNRSQLSTSSCSFTTAVSAIFSYGMSWARQLSITSGGGSRARQQLPSASSSSVTTWNCPADRMMLGQWAGRAVKSVLSLASLSSWQSRKARARALFFSILSSFPLPYSSKGKACFSPKQLTIDSPCWHFDSRLAAQAMALQLEGNFSSTRGRSCSANSGRKGPSKLQMYALMAMKSMGCSWVRKQAMESRMSCWPSCELLLAPPCPCPPISSSRMRWKMRSRSSLCSPRWNRSRFYCSIYNSSSTHESRDQRRLALGSDRKGERCS